ncbi:protein Dhp61 [Bacillus cereus group sp. MYBK69-1]|uniref:protein Dhp61 n=1 Tax=unclassified Bacillus cereus group TaxID=2750818 RepID=UPI003F79EEF5
MEDDIAGYFKQVERYDYIIIDLDKKFFYMEVVQLKTNITSLKISLNLDKDETIIAGNVKQYDPSRLEQFIQSFKHTAQTCLAHNLRSPEELFAFWKGN